MAVACAVSILHRQQQHAAQSSKALHNHDHVQQQSAVTFYTCNQTTKVCPPSQLAAKSYMHVCTQQLAYMWTALTEVSLGKTYFKICITGHNI